MNLFVFLGAPGSGKGTQAKRLSDTKSYHHLSTGDLLRKAIKENAPLGIKAKKFIDKGELVPDDVMINLIEDKLSNISPNDSIILDGFPRTVAQAEALDKKKSTQVKSAIFFEIPKSELVSRLTGRRTCVNCGESYHIVFSPPKKENHCDKCGGTLIHRPDDNENVVERRLEVFDEQNGSLLSYYKSKNNLKKLHANQPIHYVENELAKLLS